jgi:hypothetical protein
MMNNVRKGTSIAATLMLIACAGCAQVAYNSLQNSQSMRCQQIQNSYDRNECLDRSDMSYDEYQRQLNKQKSDTQAQ